MQKRILIPWSGGVDSTMLMYDAIRSGAQVSHVHLEAGQPEGAVAVEANRLGVLKRELMQAVIKTLGDKPYHYPTPVACMATMNLASTDMPFKQMPCWFMMLLSMIGNLDCKPLYDEVHLGYVLNDDASASFTDLSLAWHHLAKAIYGINFVPPLLKAPLLQTRKCHLIKDLDDLKLLPFIWYCELPQMVNGVPTECGLCPSCIRHMRSLEDLSLDREFRSNLVFLMAGSRITSQQLTTIEERVSEDEKV